MRQIYTLEDIDFLKENYPIGNWEAIFNRFPNCTKSAIYKKCNKLGIVYKKEYRDSSNYSFKKKKWTDDEIEILLKYYSFVPIDKILQLIPNRTKNSIILMANKYGLKSYQKLQEKWDKSEDDYIIKNWELTPDKVMAIKLGRTFRAVKYRREYLGLYRQDSEDVSYPTLAKYLRGQNQQWKKDSMKQCDYKCVLTGTKDFEIHHLYGVSNIINNIMNMYPKYKDMEFSDFTEDDLSFILQIFLKEQAKYPLGECVDKKLHVLFHSLYGQYYNTPEQWDKFKSDYMKGLYSNCA